MPIYEYLCRNCGERVEVLVRSDSGVPSCPQCGSSLSEKLFSVPNVISRWGQPSGGGTCCGREERCAAPPCSTGEACRRDY
jgi:putative FmdB family regulatory protein